MTKRSKRGKHKDSSEDELQSLRDSFEEDISELDSVNSDDIRNSKKEIKKKSSGKRVPKKHPKATGKRSKAKSKKNISTSEEESNDSDEDMDEDDENFEESEESFEADSDERKDFVGDENWDNKKKNQKKSQKKKSPKIKFKTTEKGKKRYISDVEDGEVATSDVVSSSDNESTVSSVFNDGYDSELLGDEEDRKRLDEMTEKEREQEIYRRTEQRDLLMRQFEMKKKIKQKEKDALKAEKKKLKAEKKRENKGRKNKSLRVGSVSSDNESQSKTKLCTSYHESKDNTSEDEDRSFTKSESIMDRRKANESKRKDTHVSKALANLKADREKKKQQAEDNRHKQEKLEQQKISKSRQAISSTSSEENSDFDKQKKSRNRRRNSDSSSYEDSEDSDRSESEDEEKIKLRKPMNSKDDLNRVKLSRFRIEKWVHAPFFKKIASGCFVRIGIGLNAGSSIYRVAEVLDVVETAKVYTLGSTKTNKGFKLRHGEDERTYRLEFVSNQPFTDTEYKRWKEAMDRGNIPLPTLGQIATKSKEMKAYNNYRFNDEDIDYIINEKKRFSQKSDKIAEKKIELLKEREEADQMGEIDRVKEIEGLIAELNEKQQESLMRRNGSFNLLATINQRNREESNKRVEDAMRMDYERQQETGDDPFKRRKGYLDVSEALKKKAVPTHTFDKEKKKNDIAATVKKNDTLIFEDLLAPVSKTSIETVPKLVELPQSYDVLQMQQTKKKEEEPKENTHNDLFMAHNFDININLTVPNFNAPAATLAPTISENRLNLAPRRGTLNLDEYKKKKGLI